MKSTPAILILIILCLPVSLKAQWKRETGFSLGLTIPSFNNCSLSNGIPRAMLKPGAYLSWTHSDKRLSIRPQVGLCSDIFSFDYDDGGKATTSTNKGNIVAFNGEMAVMGQLRITTGTMMAIGPSGKFLLTEIVNTTHAYGGGYLYPNFYSESKTNGFSRKYLNKPSLGFKVLLLKKKLNGKIKLGIIVDRQWKKEEEAYFHFSKTTEISLYIALLNITHRSI